MMIVNDHSRLGLRLRAVVFDWAGTLLDFGSCAPAATFVELFRKHGVEISSAEARQPMGMEKRDHIVHLLRMSQVADRWKQAHGRAYDERDIDRFYTDFLPLQQKALSDHAELIPGTLLCLEDCRRRDLRIGSSSGYAKELMDTLVPLAREQGCIVDAVVSASEVPAGRPAPWMIWENSRRLQVYPPATIVTVDDTPVGIQAGQNAGTWTVGVVASGNLVGLSRKQYEELNPQQRQVRLVAGHEKMKLAGAHYVVDTVAELPAVLDDIQKRLTRGERP